VLPAAESPAGAGSAGISDVVRDAERGAETKKTKSKEKGNEQVRIKAKRTGIDKKEKNAKCFIATQLS
jgi:hypothetical protein